MAQAPRRAVVKGDLVDRVVQTINRYSMLEDGDRVGIAVSGGADSVFLMHALIAIAASRNITLSVLHINHQLRGEESDADEQFVRNEASRWELPFTAMRGLVGRGNLEQGAREVRLRLLGEAKTQLALTKIALGHTRSDQAETVLFRLLRGSGTRGLASMAPSRQALIRPLLDINRAEIRGWLRDYGHPFRDDSSNQNQRFVRNRLRLRTMPALARAYNPRLEEALAGSAELFQTEEEYWTEQIEDLYRRVATPGIFGLVVDLKPLAGSHLAIRRRLLRRAILGAKGSLRSIDRRHIEEVLTVIESQHGHDRVNIPGLDVLRSFDHVLLADPSTLKQPRDYEIKLDLNAPYVLPYRAGVLRLRDERKMGPICATVEDGSCCEGEEAFLNVNAIGPAAATGDLAVRNWQPGDKLQRVGQRSPEKVKTLFQEHKVPLWCRRHWPVIAAGNEIVWVRGFGAAQQFACDRSSPDRVCVCFVPGE